MNEDVDSFLSEKVSNLLLTWKVNSITIDKNATWRWQWAHHVKCTCHMHCLRQEAAKNPQREYFLRYELLSTTFGPVQTDYRQTESDEYEPTVQRAQVGSIKWNLILIERPPLIVYQDGKLSTATLKYNLLPQWEYQFWECRGIWKVAYICEIYAYCAEMPFN